MAWLVRTTAAFSHNSFGLFEKDLNYKTLFKADITYGHTVWCHNIAIYTTWRYWLTADNAPLTFPNMLTQMTWNRIDKPCFDMIHIYLCTNDKNGSFNRHSHPLNTVIHILLYVWIVPSFSSGSPLSAWFISLNSITWCVVSRNLPKGLNYHEKGSTSV